MGNLLVKILWEVKGGHEIPIRERIFVRDIGRMKKI